jgi:hypothetical protein
MANVLQLRTRVARSVFGVLAVTAVAVACSSTSADDPKQGQDPNPFGVDGGVAPNVLVADGSANDADAKSACEELGSLKATSLTASYDTDSRWFTGAVPARPSLTQLTVLAVGSPADLQGKIVALGTGPNANYATCTHCMIVLVGCSATNCDSARKFFGEAGSAYFSQVASGPGQPFVGEFDDVTLREVKLDAKYTSTDVPSGACLHLTSFVFSGATPASATDAGDSGSSANGTGSAGRAGGATGTVGAPDINGDAVTPDAGAGADGDAGGGGGGGAGPCQPLGAVCSIVLHPCCAPLSCVSARCQ